MNNNTSKKALNQAFYANKSTFPLTFSYPSVDVSVYFDKCSWREKDAFDLVVEFHRSGKNIYFSQAWLGKKVGLGREAINRMVKRWHTLGLVHKEYRHRRTCLYKLNPYFDFPDIVSKYRHVFRAFKICALSLLMGFSTIKTTPFNIKNLNVLHGIKNTHTYLPKNKIQDLISYELREYDVPFEHKRALSSFPDHVLSYALFHFHAKRRVIRDPYKYLFKVCWDYANRLGIDPDWPWTYKIRDLHEKPQALVEDVVIKTPPVSAVPPVYNPRRGVKSICSLMKVTMKTPIIPPTTTSQELRPPEVVNNLPVGLLSKSRLEQTIQMYQKIGAPYQLFVNRQMDLVAQLTHQQRTLWNQNKLPGLI